MQIKKEYIVLTVVIALLAGYLYFHTADRTHYEVPQLPDISGVELDKLEIIKPGATVVLTKVGAGWQVTPQGYPAAADKVEAMLKAVKGLTLTTLVSESGEYARYDLQDDKKITVKAWAGGTLSRRFDIGKTASSFRHTFVTLEGDPRVYHARENLRSPIDQDAASLHDKQVLAVAPESVASFEIRSGGSTAVVTRAAADPATEAAGAQAAAEPVWQDDAGRPLDSAKIKEMLATLTRLNCDSYIYERPATELGEPLYTLVLNGAKTYTLSLFERAADNPDGPYPASSSENDYPFMLPQYRVEKIMLSLEDLAVKPAAE